LVPDERWVNLVQDILLSVDDVREAMFRYRFLPIGSSVTTVANNTISLMSYLPVALQNFKQSCNHEILKKSLADD